jgi:hypothetical protein
MHQVEHGCEPLPSGQSLKFQIIVNKSSEGTAGDSTGRNYAKA